MKNVIYTCLLILAAACNSPHTGNLIIDGDAELPPFDSVPQGWKNIKSKWVSLQGDSTNHNFGFAQHGKRFFFSGFNDSGLLQQDVDVSIYAKAIDDKRQKFILSGYERTLDQGPRSDQGILKLQCLDESKNKTLYSYSSDSLMSKEKWQAVGDTFTAPPHTRFVRVQLVDVLNFGMGIDGYFDNLSLVAPDAGSAFNRNNIMMIGAVALLVILFSIVIYRNRHARNKQATKKSIP